MSGARRAGRPAQVERLAIERLGLGVAAGRSSRLARLLRLVAMLGCPAGRVARQRSSASR